MTEYVNSNLPSVAYFSRLVEITTRLLIDSLDQIARIFPVLSQSYGGCAVTASPETRKTFRRDKHVLLSWFMRRLPPSPDPFYEEETSWRRVRQSTTLPLIGLAVLMLAAVICAIQFLIWEWPALRISPLSIVLDLGYSIWHWEFAWYNFIPQLGNPTPGSEAPGVVALIARGILTLIFLGGGFALIKLTPQFALVEEQAFRQGAEHWTRRERLRSSVLFGFAHIGNLFYPLATLLVLCVGGLIFTSCYLRECRRSNDSVAGVHRATALHSIYNAMAITVFVGYMMWAFWIV
jgi:hypothetical protein